MPLNSQLYGTFLVVALTAILSPGLVSENHKIAAKLLRLD